MDTTVTAPGHLAALRQMPATRPALAAGTSTGHPQRPLAIGPLAALSARPVKAPIATSTSTPWHVIRSAAFALDGGGESLIAEVEGCNARTRRPLSEVARSLDSRLRALKF